MMNQISIRTDKGEYYPGETVCGAVYVDIHTPTEAHGVQLSFKGRESVTCECEVEGTKTSLQASNDYVDYCNADLFTQKEPFALGSYCFPFRLQIPHVTPGTFCAGSSEINNVWSASVTYRLHTNILGADDMRDEQDVVVSVATPEALKDNSLTQAQSLQISSGSFFRRKVHITVKSLSKYVRSGENARLKMVLTNQLSARSCMFSIKLVRLLTLTLPYKPRPGLDASGDHGAVGSQAQSVQQHTLQVEGGPIVVREVTGDLSQHSSVTFARGGGLDNIMIPLKAKDGKSVIPSVQGKYVQCQYSLEVSLRVGDNSAQSVSCPIQGVLPVENAQWLAWKPSPWMHTAHVKLSKTPGPISPPEQLLESEAFTRLPRFQEL